MTVDDSFDYTDTSGDPTNLALSYENGTLVFHFGGAAGGALPLVDIGDSPRFDDADDVPDNDYLADEIPGVELEVRAGTLFAAGFSHEAESLAVVVDAYVAELGDLGFTAELESSDGNVIVYRFANDAGSLRGVFTATAAGGHAYLATNL